MRIYFEVTGIVCLLYYFIISFYTRKWNSTFALFWPAFGGIHILLRILSIKGKWNVLLLAAVFIFWVVFFVVEMQICAGMLKYL